jgi:hypothetical protein
MSPTRISGRPGSPAASAAVGFRVKSGWALAVLVAGSSTAPVLLDVRKVQLANPSVPESAQPYHAVLDLPEAEGEKVVRRLVKVVERFARKSIAALLEEYCNGGLQLVGAGVVVGSQIDPVKIANDHIHAHAEEGRLFRQAVVGSVVESGLEATVIAEKALFAVASTRLHRTAAQLKKDLIALGRSVDGSWRSEEKGAALAAWLVLA